MGLKLMYQRKVMKLTQKQVAEVLGVSTQAVSEWERGTYKPHLTPRQTSDFCKLLQIDVHQLAEMVDDI